MDVPADRNHQHPLTPPTLLDLLQPASSPATRDAAVEEEQDAVPEDESEDNQDRRRRRSGTGSDDRTPW